MRVGRPGTVGTGIGEPAGPVSARSTIADMGGAVSVTSGGHRSVVSAARDSAAHDSAITVTSTLSSAILHRDIMLSESSCAGGRWYRLDLLLPFQLTHKANGHLVAQPAFLNF